ncbi:hypothetical protein SDC9_181437 [bioreactor metagenome]|uniref:Uncharacterized protein n=1 Tax=bioreactor metagenome TaxID=1076179 RepID=A0A645H4K8_9ZZZZ
MHPFTFGPVERRRCHTHVQSDDIPFGRIVGHRISTYGIFFVLSHPSPHLILIPFTLILIIDNKIGVFDLVVLWHPDLDI